MRRIAPRLVLLSCAQDPFWHFHVVIWLVIVFAAYCTFRHIACSGSVVWMGALSVMLAGAIGFSVFIALPCCSCWPGISGSCLGVRIPARISSDCAIVVSVFALESEFLLASVLFA